MKTVLYKKEKGKFKKISYGEFPSSPTSGIWLVLNGAGITSHSCIVRIADVPKCKNIPKKVALSKHLTEICSILQNHNGKSTCDIANQVIDFICSLGGK